MKRKTMKAALLLLAALLTAAIAAACGEEEEKMLDLTITDGVSPAFHFTLDELIGQFNREYGEDYLTPSDGSSPYEFTEDESIRTLPKMVVNEDENGWVVRMNLFFDWHSMSEPLMEKYRKMCICSMKCFFPEWTDEKAEAMCEEIINAGYDHPMARGSEVPYAVYHSGNVGITTRFAMGESQVISILPVTEDILASYEKDGAEIVAME